MPKRKLKIGVIGCGVMGQNHIKICKNLKDVELKGVCDINYERAKKTGNLYNVPYYTDYRKLIEEGNIDIANIVVPTTYHAEIALACLQAGINILVEKPIADAVEKGKKIAETAKKLNLKFMVGHTERFNPAIIELKKIINSNFLGEITSISTKRVGPFPSRSQDVGVILDLGTHDIDIISYLYNEKVKEVYAIAGSQMHSCEDHASLMLRFYNGNSGMIEANWLTPHRMRKLSVVGFKGTAALDFIEQKLLIFKNGDVQNIDIDEKPPLVCEIEHFVDCVRNNKEPLVTGEESVHALAVALAAISSYKNKKAIKITNSSWDISSIPS